MRKSNRPWTLQCFLDYWCIWMRQDEGSTSWIAMFPSSARIYISDKKSFRFSSTCFVFKKAMLSKPRLTWALCHCVLTRQQSLCCSKQWAVKWGQTPFDCICRALLLTVWTLVLNINRRLRTQWDNNQKNVSRESSRFCTNLNLYLIEVNFLNVCAVHTPASTYRPYCILRRMKNIPCGDDSFKCMFTCDFIKSYQQWLPNRFQFLKSYKHRGIHVEDRSTRIETFVIPGRAKMLTFGSFLARNDVEVIGWNPIHCLSNPKAFGSGQHLKWIYQVLM